MIYDTKISYICICYHIHSKPHKTEVKFAWRATLGKAVCLDRVAVRTARQDLWELFLGYRVWGLGLAIGFRVEDSCCESKPGKAPNARKVEQYGEVLTCQDARSALTELCRVPNALRRNFPLQAQPPLNYASGFERCDGAA